MPDNKSKDDAREALAYRAAFEAFALALERELGTDDLDTLYLSTHRHETLLALKGDDGPREGCMVTVVIAFGPKLGKHEVRAAMRANRRGQPARS